MDPRAAAARAIGNVLDGQSLNRALPSALKKVGTRDRGLMQELCYGSLRHHPWLLAVLEQLLDKPLRAKDNDVKALLLCGLYQIEYMRTPEHAAVAATVEASKTLRKNWAKGLTNAILRRFLRERDSLVTQLDEPALNSHPAWLYDKLRAQWPDHLERIVQANNHAPPMTLRANQLHGSREDLINILSEEGIATQTCAFSDQGITLEEPRDVLELPGFSDGMASVQDEAAQLAAVLLGAQPGERILDACAAPGGKTCHILEAQPELAEMVAMDVDEQRLTRIAENLDRLQLSAQLLCGDAAEPPATLAAASFDRILVDVPCSASGVIRRHPDVKLLRRGEDFSSMASQQLQILNGVWPLLKPGGTALYATCSIFDEENSQVVQRFLDGASDATLKKLPLEWGEETACGRQLLPDPAGPDGLFYAVLEKST